MKKRITMLLAGLFLVMGTALAQKVVSGTVVSAEDGEPVIGATVKAAGSAVGTATDIDGNFSFELPAGETKVVVSYVGKQAQTLTATTGMQIQLKDDAHTMNEVVVTAMGIKREAKALGYSATSVKGEDLAKARTNDIMSSLAGKVAGVNISTGSSDPGASQSVIIRGVSSLSGSNQPLYVVDGVPLTNTSITSSNNLNNGFDFGNGAAAVNPNDVESMTILKGAAATALYGSRAANGVIVITTKSGKAHKGIGVEYNGGLQWESLLRIPQLQNQFGMGWYGEKTDIENGSWGPAFDGSLLRYGQVYNNSQQMKSYLPIKNNIKDFFDTGFRYNNSISINGGNDKTTYYASLSQIHEDGIIPTNADSYNKYTFSARGSHKVGNLMISTSLNYAYQKNSFVSTGQGAGSMYNNIVQTPRDISIAELKDLSNPFNTPGYYYTPYGVTNPYYILENYENEYEAERFYGKLQLDYDFTPYLKLSYRFGLDTNTGHRFAGRPNIAALYPNTPNYDDALKSLTGSVVEQTTREREIDQNIMLTFDKDLDKDFHLNALVGFNGNERKYSYLYDSVTNLTIPTWLNLSNSAEKPTLETYSRTRRLMGVFGQAEVSWRNMAYLTMTARNDWSSTLPKGKRSFFYPGVTASFLASQLFSEDFRNNVINFAKVRLAWGKTGNDAAPYRTSTVFAQALANSSGWYSSEFPFSKIGMNAYTLSNSLGSIDLKPEMTSEFEFGLNMAFLHNRISFDFAYYNRISDKQIFSLEMDPSSGYSTQVVNLGKIRNRGIELLINTTPVKTQNFQWDLSWNYTLNRSKVLSLPEQMAGESLIYGLTGDVGLYAIEGKELGLYKGYIPQTTADGKIIVDAQGLPLKNETQQVIGSMNNKYQMGFTNTLRYKNVSLSFDIDVRRGGIMYSQTKKLFYFTGNAMQTTYNNRNPWVIPNSVVQTGTDATGNPIYSENTVGLTANTIYNYWDNGGLMLNKGAMVSRSYVKLRSVVLSWSLPKNWLRKTFLNDVTLSVFGNNLLMWTPSSNTFIDPESTSFGNDLKGNYGEYAANPSSRKYGFNVSVKF